jgi:elongation factor P--(R)-beta-lysine ligase
VFFFVVGERVEPQIGKERLCVVERWPASMAVLARRCDDDPRYAARFEIYGGGLELCNAFDELTDAVEQRARFEDDLLQRAALGKRALPIEEESLELLPKLKRSAGNALGFDRALMLLSGERSVVDVGP